MMMEFHEVANIFPMMNDDEYNALVVDIKAHGQLEPVWLYQGKIIDGRNRYKACVEAGIEPQFREWSGHGSLIAFVVSLNLQRRHLTSSQKAMVAVEIEKHLAEENKVGRPAKDGNNSGISGESRQHAAALVGTNSHYVTDAKRIIARMPAFREVVLNGDLSIPEALYIARTTPEDQRGAVLEKVQKRKTAGLITHPVRAIRYLVDEVKHDAKYEVFRREASEREALRNSPEYKKQAEEQRRASEEKNKRQWQEIREREAAWADAMKDALNVPGSEQERIQLYEAAREANRQLHQAVCAYMIFLMRFEDLAGEIVDDDIRTGGLLQAGRQDRSREFFNNEISHYAHLVNGIFRRAGFEDCEMKHYDASKGRLEGMLERCDNRFFLAFAINGVSGHSMPSIDIEALHQWIEDPSHRGNSGDEDE